MSGAFFNVSGIDPNDGAKIVFVWCRARGQDTDTLVGSGHVVGAGGGGGLPPGIRVGQFSVTFELPAGCPDDSVVVTDDKSGKDFLPGVTLVACRTSARLQSG